MLDKRAISKDTPDADIEQVWIMHNSKAPSDYYEMYVMRGLSQHLKSTNLTALKRYHGNSTKYRSAHQ